ncbi:MAG: hypothetical protein PVF73_01015 [Bacteroidales bacterium]|jgi:hypothetical protein
MKTINSAVPVADISSLFFRQELVQPRINTLTDNQLPLMEEKIMIRGNKPFIGNNMKCDQGLQLTSDTEYISESGIKNICKIDL